MTRPAILDDQALRIVRSPDDVAQTLAQHVGRREVLLGALQPPRAEWINQAVTPSGMTTRSIRHLVFILGDQLDSDSAALADFDADKDVVFMAEVAHESTRVWSHVARTALFLSDCTRMKPLRKPSPTPSIVIVRAGS